MIPPLSTIITETLKPPLQHRSIAASAIARAASSETSRCVTIAWAEAGELSPADYRKGAEKVQ